MVVVFVLFVQDNYVIGEDECLSLMQNVSDRKDVDGADMAPPAVDPV